MEKLIYEEPDMVVLNMDKMRDVITWSSGGSTVEGDDWCDF